MSNPTAPVLTQSPQLLVNREKCMTLFNQLVANKTQYGLNSKPRPLNVDPVKIKAVDCSGLVHYLIHTSSDAKSFPDGSWKQWHYLTNKKFKPVDYKNKASLQDGWLRIAFIKPKGGHPGHVWLIHNGQTIESHGGKGPDRRLWNTSILTKEVSSCFELGPM